MLELFWRKSIEETTLVKQTACPKAGVRPCVSDHSVEGDVDAGLPMRSEALAL